MVAPTTLLNLSQSTSRLVKKSQQSVKFQSTTACHRDGVGRGNLWLAIGTRGASECLANSFDTDASSGIDTSPRSNAILDHGGHDQLVRLN